MKSMRNSKKIFEALVLIVVLALGCSSAYAVSLPFEDGFENIAIGDYPDENGWRVLFSGKNAYVSDTVAHAGMRSFRLDSWPNWAHMDYVHLEDMPDRLTYEVSIYIDPTYGKGAIAGFMTGVGNMGPTWNRVSISAVSGKVFFGGVPGFEDVVLGTYTPGTWCTLRVDLDFVSLTANVWLDGDLVAEELHINPKEFDQSTYGHIVLNQWGVVSNNYASGSTNVVYFDDVKLYETPVEPCALRGRIAFVSPHPDEGGRLWIMDVSAGLSSKTEVPLPADLEHIGCPEWSQDGSMITFHAVRSGQTKAGIYVVKPDGSGFCKVSPDGWDIGHPSFSPDGTQIVGCTSLYRLYIFTKVGECEWQSTYLAPGVHSKWSPDGNKIAYSNWGLTYDSDVFAYHLDTNYSILITPHNPGKAFNHAIWSPDGTKLALVELDRSTNKDDLWIVNADGSDRVNLTVDWAASDELWPTWSADGQYIVFSSDRSGNWDLWYTPVDGFSPVNISHSPEDEVMPAMTLAGPDAGLVAYWSFDDALDPGHDDSGNGHDGTVYGAASIDGVCGDALSFDGVDDYVDMGIPPDLRVTGALTASTWIQAGSAAMDGHISIVSRHGWDIYDQWSWGLRLYNGAPQGWVSESGDWIRAATGQDAVDTDAWHHIAMTYEPGVFLRIYLDGAIIAEEVTNVPGAINDPEEVLTYVGAIWWRTEGPPSHYFTGNIDEVRIYDRALSECEIRELATPCEQPECWQEQQKLLASDGAVGDSFGNSVSIDDTYTIVGAFYDDNRTGSAYIFKKSNIPGDSNWYQQVKLNASDEAEGDRFGITVLISGDYAIVGADSDDDNGWHSGSAYIFKKSNIPNDPNWYEQCKLTASDGTAGDLFGRSVAIDGDYAIVGAYGDGSVSGSAYIFKKSETPDDPKWYEQCKLTASDGAAGDHFGHTVAISGDYVILEAHHDDDNGSSSGSAYIFKKSETPGDPKWYEQCKLTASDGAAGDYFGHSSISLNNDYTIVGAFGDDDKGDHSGAAYIFKKSEIPSDPNWYEQCKLTASDGTSGDLFGRSALIRGDYAIVGAAYDDDNGSLAGSVYIFKKSETPGDPNWYEQSKLIASDAANGDHFGISVAFNGYYAIVGAYFNDDNGANSGSAYIFENVCNTEPIADAGDDQEVSTGPGGEVEVVLDCSDSNDPDGDELTYCWKWTGGEECDATGVNPTIVLSCGTYVIELIVNDGTADSEPDYVEITVLDGTAPVISCPGNVTLECPADTNPANTGSSTATDNCDDDPAITYSDVISGTCPVVIVRTWTATDDAGNSSSCEQTITVQDTTPPVISCPADVVLECPADTTPGATGSATATDTCGSVTVTYSDVSVPVCGNTKVITRTWTATDECGNSSTCIQTIEVVDTTPPVISCPADVTLECPVDTNPSETGQATATDTCGNVTITHSDVWVSACGMTGILTRTWTATDECGNSSNCVQTITVIDTTEPEVTIVVPQEDAALQDGVTLTAGASDTCGAVTNVYFYIREPGGASGIPIGQEDLPAVLNAVSGKWEYAFDTIQLLDGYYVILAKAIDECGNEGWSEVVVQFSIRNWAVIELLPASEDNKAGRTMPVKFALRIAESVDPAMPFVYNEQLEIRIYDAAEPGTILQTSVFGEGAKDYRIESIEELYITNFKTKKDPAQYVVEIWRPSKNFMVGSFGFETVK